MSPRRSLAWLVVPLALLLAWGSLRTALAYQSLREAQEYVTATQARGGTFLLERWRDAHASTQRARAWWPGNAEIAEWHARVALLGAASAQLPPDESARLRADAIAALREAVAMRPRWPYAWATLALAKAAAGEVDEELERAVANAARFGPHEPRIRPQLADVYLSIPRERAQRSAPLRAAWAAMLREAPTTWIDRADRRARGQGECTRGNLPEAAVARCRQLGWL